MDSIKITLDRRDSASSNNIAVFSYSSKFLSLAQDFRFHESLCRRILRGFGYLRAALRRRDRCRRRDCHRDRDRAVVAFRLSVTDSSVSQPIVVFSGALLCIEIIYRYCCLLLVPS